jgi:hypothetical protein
MQYFLLFSVLSKVRLYNLYSLARDYVYYTDTDRPSFTFEAVRGAVHSII